MADKDLVSNPLGEDEDMEEVLEADQGMETKQQQVETDTFQETLGSQDTRDSMCSGDEDGQPETEEEVYDDDDFCDEAGTQDRSLTALPGLSYGENVVALGESGAQHFSHPPTQHALLQEKSRLSGEVEAEDIGILETLETQQWDGLAADPVEEERLAASDQYSPAANGIAMQPKQQQHICPGPKRERFHVDNVYIQSGSKGMVLTGGLRKHKGSPSSRLILAQRARKAAQEDVQRMATRLQQLRKEEEKALKRICETRKRAAEIMDLRRRNEEMRMAREMAAQERKVLLENAHAHVVQLVDERRRRRGLKAQAMNDTKRTESVAMREQRQQLERELAERKKEDKQRVQQLKDAIRTHHLLLRERTLQQKQQYLAKARSDFERKVQEESAMAEAQAKSLSQMAREEMDLIVRLQHKQEEQGQAYEELERALGLFRRDKANVLEEVGDGDDGQGRGGNTGRGEGGKIAMGVGDVRAVHGALSADPREEEAAISAEFRALDPTGSGTIATSQLEELLSRLGERLTKEQVATATYQLDPLSSGRIHYGEFLLWWRG